MAAEHEIDAAGGQRPVASDEDGPGGGERGDGRSYMGLAGDAFADFDRVVCSQCDYAYPVLDVQDPTPLPERCPNDDSTLIHRSAGWQPGAE
ncbi:hypothetical protein OG373_35595 [Streptomyces avidinii]|uniref:hypothetical protein n=1 Tax=Streptomyces avidinii TaxID=1895 RepID=UPI00386F161D|nr:hypothetical protein OG373_35595 [Streptomyces avidinii]